MQKQRHSICIIFLIGTMLLAACSASQAPDNLQVSPSNYPSIQPSHTRSATRTPKFDRSTSVPAPTRSLTPTLDIAHYANSWTRYRGNYGISFEYPTIYLEKPYQGICEAVESRDGAEFGEKSKVFFRQQHSPSLEKYIQSFIPTYHPDEQFKLESQVSMQINGRPAITIKYKLGEAAESRTLIFIADSKGKAVFTFSFVGGNACDVPELGISEETVFQHAVNTFQIEE